MLGALFGPGGNDFDEFVAMFVAALLVGKSWIVYEILSTNSLDQNLPHCGCSGNNKRIIV